MIHVVFGGQFGSEGKGALIAHLSRTYEYDWAVRAGGPQAGHTFAVQEYGVWRKKVVRQVPVPCVVQEDCQGYIGPGALIDQTTLETEINRFALQGRLWVHPHATLVTDKDRKMEERYVEQGLIPGSTKEGVGAVRAMRALRMAQPIGSLVPCPQYVDSSLERYHELLAATAERLVLAEGTQGFGLSLFHGHYPYVTSADTTPAAILSECGLPSTGGTKSLVVLRTFPIRVGGPSGPMYRELEWSKFSVEPEVTTVTQRPRRIGEFDWNQFEHMVRVCRPTEAALMFCDYLDPWIRTKALKECPSVLEFWSRINRQVACPFIGVGGDGFQVKDIRGEA